MRMHRRLLRNYMDSDTELHPSVANGMLMAENVIPGTHPEKVNKIRVWGGWLEGAVGWRGSQWGLTPLVRARDCAEALV